MYHAHSKDCGWLPALFSLEKDQRDRLGELFLLIVGSQKVVLGSYLYHPTIDLLYNWMYTQCPNQLLYLMPSCHFGNIRFCHSSFPTTFGTFYP